MSSAQNHPRQSALAILHSIVQALNRIATAVESQNSLGDPVGTRYTRRPNDCPDLINEVAMAQLLDISPRTLAQHRRRGKFPNCWIRNGRRVLWKVEQALEAWKRGLP